MDKVYLCFSRYTFAHIKVKMERSKEGYTPKSKEVKK